MRRTSPGRFLFPLLRRLCRLLGWTVLCFGCLFAVLLTAEFGVTLRGILFAALCMAIGAGISVPLLLTADKLRKKPSAAQMAAQVEPAPPVPQKTPAVPPSNTVEPPSDAMLSAVLRLLLERLSTEAAPFFVASALPRREQEAICIVRPDAAEPGKLRFIAGVRRRDSDLFMQHYLFAGTKEALADYFQAQGTVQELRTSLAALSDALYDRYD